MSKLRIVLADDHGLVREGLKRLIDDEPDMHVVGEAADGESACSQCAVLRPDVVLMDLSLPDLSGIEATRRVLQANPKIKVVGLTVHEDHGYVRELLDAGAAGYVLKRAASTELAPAIRAVLTGGVYVDPRIASTLIGAFVRPRWLGGAEHAELSERELEVMRGIARGYSNKEIAAQLDLSVKTVETYKARSMEKLGLKSRVDLVRLATSRGWLTAGAA
jgi:DNA-binding NarL/FixJ family response regulator